MRRRILSLVTVAVILFTSICSDVGILPVSAEEGNEPIAVSEEPSNELLITDCETLEGWSKTGGNSLSINANGFTGKAIHCDVGNGAFRTATYTAPIALDISLYQNIEWDVMMFSGTPAVPGMWDEIKEYYGDAVYLKIGSSASDYNVYRLSKMTVVQDTGNNLWYHFSINVDDPSSRAGDFDPAAMTTFYFSTIDGNVNSSVRSGSIRIDNIYARNLRPAAPEEPDPPAGPIIISDGSSNEGWALENGNSVNINNNQGLPAPSMQVDTGYGALRKLTYTCNLDMTEYPTIEWDWFVIVIKDSVAEDNFETALKSYGDTTAMEVNDGTNTVVFDLAKWELVNTNGMWRHFAVSLADSGLNLATIKTISFYTCPINGGTLDTSLNSMVYRFDNIQATDKDVIPNMGEEEPEDPTGTVVITDCDSISDWTSEVPSSGLSVGTGKGIDRGNAVHASGGWGLLRKLTYNPSAGINLKGKTTLEWDLSTVCGTQDTPGYVQGQEMFEVIAKAYGSYMGVEVSDGTATAVIGYDKWQIGEVVANNYRHFAVSLEGYGLDLANIDSISFYVMKNDANGNADRTLPTAVFFRFDNMIATTNTVTPNGGQGGEEPDPPEDPTGPILISDGSSIDGWTLERGTLTTNTDQGLPKPSMQVGAGNGALRKLTYTGSLNLSEYSTIEWDWFVMDDTTKEDAFETALNSYRATTALEVSDGKTTVVFDLSKWEMEDTEGMWRHFAVSLAGSGLDLSFIQTISFYACPVEGGVLDTSLPLMIYRFDNIKATDKAVTPNMSKEPQEEPDDENRLLISNCETTDNWSYEQPSQTLLNRGGRNGNAVQVFTGYGALRRITYTRPADDLRDFSNYHKIGFDFRVLNANTAADMWETIQSTYKNYIGVEISDGANSEKFKLADIAITELGSSWYHAEVEVPSDSTVDLSKFAAFTFYVLPVGLGNPDTSLNNANYQIDNLAAYASAGQPAKKNITGTYFSDGMMFQQNKPMTIFGNVGQAGQTVSADLIKDSDGSTVASTQTTSLGDGSFELAFSGRAGSYDTYHIDLYLNGALTQIIRNVVIGELWLAAGQSNMEYFVWQTIPGYDEALVETNKNVRFFDVPLVPGGTTAILPATPADNIEDAFWNDGSKVNNVKYVSAIAYYMSLQLEEELGVPVGFINAAKGASLIESWIPRSAVENDSVIKDTLVKRGLYKTEAELGTTESNWTYLTTLYNSKIAPYAGISIGGMLWYQGESNVKYANDDGYNTFYEHALKALIDTYSKDFGYENGGMPFVCAHLAPYNNRAVRAEDYMTVLASFAEMLSNVASETNARMIQIPIYDLPLDYFDPPTVNPDPIHPNSKQAVGSRYAAAVLAGVYGNGNGFTAPTVSGFKIDGRKIVLTFANVGVGLQTIGGASDLNGFAIAGSDRVFVKAQAEITSADTVTVWSDYVTAPVAVTYAWSSFNMTSNLANSNGIPAVPYRSDPTESVYYLSMDWADFDSTETWDALTTTDAGFKPAYAVSSGASAMLEENDKVSGDAAVRFNYTAGDAWLAPILSYGGMINQFSSYSGLTVSVKNTDSRAKKLSVQIVSSGEVYNASVVTGTELATSYDLPTGDYGSYTFNLTRLVNADGKVLSDSTTALKQMTELRLCISDTSNGEVLFDALTMRVDTLPAPGSENDELTDGPEDTTPGSVGADGNMWVSSADSLNGWSASGQLVLDTSNYTEGTASVGTSSENGVLRQIVFSPGYSLDVSEYDYLEFDLYVSNMAWYGLNNIMFELTSSGGPDQESDRYMKGKLESANPEFAAAVKSTNGPRANQRAVAAADASGAGWYHIRLPLRDAQGQANGGLDLTCFNFFRFYATGAPAGSPDFEVRFDNMKFTKKTTSTSGDPSYGKVIDDDSMWMTDSDSLVYWRATGAQAQLDDTVKSQGKSSVSVTAEGGILRQLAYIPDYAIDISDYQYLEFDMYFTNLNWYSACEGVMFELTSAGTSDDKSSRYTKSSMLKACPAFAADAAAGTGGGKWYHFKLSLDAPQTKVKGGLDKKEFNFFRFYTVGAPEGTPDYTLYIDNMKFTKGPVDSSGSSSGGGSGGDSGNNGRASGNADPSYGKVIDADSMWMTDCETLNGWRANGAQAMLDSTIKTQGESSVSVTAQGGILRQIAYIPGSSIDISDYQYLEFDIYFSNLDWYFAGDSTMFELTSAGTSDKESNRYTKSSMLEACPEFAADVEAGKGGGKWYHFKLNLDMPHAKVNGGLNKEAFNFFRFYSVQVASGTPDYTLYIDNMRFTKGEGIAPIEKTEEYIIIHNCDSAAGWSSPGQEVMLDTVNKVSGKGSVTVTAKGGILKELVYRPNEPIDLTGYRYLQFDLFLSNIACLDVSNGFMVEMTSSGTCDIASNRWMKSMILLACPELAQDLDSGEAGNKWYHFCFDMEKPQNQANGGLDITAFNYFRIYFIGAPEGTPDCVVNLDHLMVTVTDGSAENETPSEGEAPSQESQIIFPTSGSSAGGNIGNKRNGGLLSEAFEPVSESLKTAVIVMGGVSAAAFIGVAVLLFLSLRSKKRKTLAKS